MYYIGIDLGGTNIAAGITDKNGKIIIKDSTPTLASRPSEEIMEDICLLCEKLIRDAGMTNDDIQAIGIGCPGLIDNENGIVSYAHNLNMRDVRIGEFLEKRLGKPVNVENDADAAALGEYTITGNGAESFVFITLGTGVGGGIIRDGKIYRGFNGISPELGHITIVSGGERCSCNKEGCWEAYASVTALRRQTKLAMDNDPDTIMHEIAQERGKISGRTAFIAAKQGDRTAMKVVEQYQRYIADGLVSIINMLQPEVIAVGGGISKEGDYLLDAVRDYVKEYEFNQYRIRTQIKTAVLFNDAGISGAALSAMK